jgi:class 3 adenylate cyclase
MPVATLTSAFDALQQAGFSALVWDARFRVVGVTDEALTILRLGTRGLDPPLGRHMFSADWVTLMERLQGGATLDSQRTVFRALAPSIVAANDGDAEAVRATVDSRLHDLLDGVEAEPGPPVWTTRIDVNFGDRTTPLDVLVVTLRDPDGQVAGGATISKPGVGGAVMAVLATGDATMFDRMLGLLEPARRASAILFADLESSTPLSRRLSTHGYFALMRRLFYRADRSVVSAGGIVGKHVGDGITAFFLPEHAGSESRAARACIETAQRLREDAAAAAERSHVDPGQVVLRMGLHWGAGAYIGRLLTSGRTEVTALGDEVNEAARIEACAAGGLILASKTLIERLNGNDAIALGLIPGDIEYRPLGDFPDATGKALRDAPLLPVTVL